MIKGLLGQLGPVIMFHSEMEATVGLGVLKTWGEQSVVGVKEKTPEDKQGFCYDKLPPSLKTPRPYHANEDPYKKTWVDAGTIGRKCDEIQNEAITLSIRINKFEKRISELEDKIGETHDSCSHRFVSYVDGIVVCDKCKVQYGYEIGK